MTDQNPIQPPEEPEVFPAPKKPAELLANLHSFEPDKDYTPPQWGAKPTKNYFLEIIKNGVVIGQQDLTVKSFYLVGKLQDLCDISLEHPSISRKHAVFQHRNDGALYLYDLGSTHGVKVNKRDLPPRTFHKLGVGDVIKFGFSTRLFIVGLDGETSIQEGDEKLIATGFARPGKATVEEAPSTKATLKAKYLDLLNRSNGRQGFTQPKKVAPRDPSEVSWGMVDEDEIRAYENEEDIRLDPDLLRELPDLGPKDYDKINEYEKKLRQLENLERELNVIYKKEQEEFGLTENDKQKRQGLETKVNEMFSKVQIMEDNLRFALFEEVKSQDRVARRREADSFEDDEFYDRTIKKVKLDEHVKDKKETAPEGETFESLKKKLEDMISLRQELNEKILALALNPELDAGNGAKEEKKEEEMDELDKFMQENDSKVKAESRTTLLEGLKDTNAQIQELQRMLKFVRPSYNQQEIQYDKEERKTQAPSNVPAKPDPKQQQKATLEKIKQMNKNPGAEPVQPPRQTRDEEIDTLEEPTRRQPMEAPKKKVYGVAARPAPRNLRESDYENPDYVDTEWVPPSDKGESI